MGADRAAVVVEARTWIGTPYVKKGRIKGIGADCFTFLAEIMIICGLFKPMDLPAYQDDWFAHCTDEEYLKLLYRHCRRTLETVAYGRPMTGMEPGNIVVTRSANSRIFNHGGIILAWPQIAHCVYDGVQETNASGDPMWAYRPIQVYDPFDWPAR